MHNARLNERVENCSLRSVDSDSDSGTDSDPDSDSDSGSDSDSEDGWPERNNPPPDYGFGITDRDIELVMHQARTTRAIATAALRRTNGDIVDAIMELTR